MRVPTTFERLVWRFEADEDRCILISTVGPSYAITESEDLYFRCLYAALKCGYTQPNFG